MATWKTQDMYGIAEKLGTLTERTETLMDYHKSLTEKIDDMRANGLPSCQTHTKRMEAIEKRLESRNSSAKCSVSESSATFAYGKWKATGIAAIVVGAIIATGIAMMLIKQIK